METSLPLPDGLVRLIESDAWPTQTTANAQNLTPLATKAAIRRVAPEEQGLYLEPPPFRTLATEIARAEGFWREHGALDQIDPDLALVIGDFGAGSEALIALDYRSARAEPCVVRLRWMTDGNRWVEVAPSFDAFAHALELA